MPQAPRAAGGGQRSDRVVDRGDYLRRLGQARAQAQPAGCDPAAQISPLASQPQRSRSKAQLGAVEEASRLLLSDAGAAGVGVPAQHCSHAPGGGGGAAALAGAIGVGSGLGGLGQKVSGASAPRTVKDNFVNRVVDRCGPAVVRVEVEQKVEVPSLDNADLFSFFFGLRPDQAKKQERRVSGHGSGFCVDGANGIILTNAHVVQDADRITVSFAGLRGETIECEVLETDEVIDLAVIKTKERPKRALPSMPMGHSESLRTGDWAIVLGNPFGLQNTCTLGIVSSMDRSTGETGFDWMRHPLLQTDAAVNQGNSGGPLLNENGEVVGIVSMRALFGEGIGFAIPVDSAKAALPNLLQRKKVPRAYLGLKMAARAGGARRGAGGRGGGAIVDLVLPKSPAEAAGFRPDDEIVDVDGRKIHSFEEVQGIVRSTPVGTKLRFQVRRADRSATLEVKAADIQHLREVSTRGPRGGGGGGGGKHIIIMQ